MLGELKASFTSAGEEGDAGGDAETALEPGRSYYAGDCAALCELVDGRLTAVSHEIMGACSRMAAVLGSRPIAIVPCEADDSIADELRTFGAQEAVFHPGA